MRLWPITSLRFFLSRPKNTKTTDIFYSDSGYFEGLLRERDHFRPCACRFPVYSSVCVRLGPFPSLGVVLAIIGFA
jgi:hypothetical protein